MRIALGVLYIGGMVPTVAIGNINVELHPQDQTVAVGDTVNVGLYVVSDDDSIQLMSAAEVIIAWDPTFLELLGNDNTGAVELLSSVFPENDPYNLNEVIPPADGDGLYVALAPLGIPVQATPDGTLLTTLQFLALADTPATPVDILETGGDPQGETRVLDGTVPNLNVTGSLSGSAVEILLGPTLRLTAEAGDSPGLVDVTLWMFGLGSQEAASFQAYLEFDSSLLSFVEGAYTPEPFGAPLFDPIVAVGEDIDLAAEIDVDGGQTPTSENAALAELTFEVLEPLCVLPVNFRDHVPATAIEDIDTDPIVPLALEALPAIGSGPDTDLDGDVDVSDLLALLANWGSCPAPPQPCIGDVDCDGDVDVSDLLALIAAWGPYPP